MAAVGNVVALLELGPGKEKFDSSTEKTLLGDVPEALPLDGDCPFSTNCPRGWLMLIVTAKVPDELGSLVCPEQFHEAATACQGGQTEHSTKRSQRRSQLGSIVNSIGNVKETQEYWREYGSTGWLVV